MPASSENVAVVGATGFLGSHIVRALVEGGYAPLALVRNPERLARRLPDIQLEVRRADITDMDSLRVALQGCTVVHLAAALLNQVYTAASPRLEAEATQTNVQGTLNVLRASRMAGVRRVVVTGTCSARYQTGGTTAREDSPPTDLKQFSDAYVKSKVLAEAAAAEYTHQTGMELVTLLPGALIGPGDWGPTPFNLTVLDRINGSHLFSIEGSFPLVDVRDVARGHVIAMHRGEPGASCLMVAASLSSHEWDVLLNRVTAAPKAHYYLSPRTAMVMATAMEGAARLTHRAPFFTRNMVRHVIQNQQYDCSCVQRELGVTFTPLETSVRDMVQWYIEQGWVAHPERLWLR